MITDKTRPHTARRRLLKRLVGEIAASLAVNPGLRLLLGHGSGSFGHVPALKYGTRRGVYSAEEWSGFAEVWYEARALNQIVMEALHAVHLPAVAFPPSAVITAENGQILRWDLGPLLAVLEHGLLPVVYGDVVIDTERGGTILSTEDIFVHLAQALRPQRLLLAGLEAGVWADYPACTRLIPEITPDNLAEIEAGLDGSAAADVTGGMESKVRQVLTLIEAVPGLEALIFSGRKPGNLRQALNGQSPGTRLRGSESNQGKNPS